MTACDVASVHFGLMIKITNILGIVLYYDSVNAVCLIIRHSEEMIRILFAVNQVHVYIMHPTKSLMY